MTWTLKFWDSAATPPVSWNWLALGTIPPGNFPGTQASDIAVAITSIGLISTLATSRLDAYGQDIRIGYGAGDVGHAFRGPIDDYIIIDIVAARTLYFFNSFGELVPGNIGLAPADCGDSFLNALLSARDTTCPEFEEPATTPRRPQFWVFSKLAP